MKKNDYENFEKRNDLYENFEKGGGSREKGGGGNEIHAPSACDRYCMQIKHLDLKKKITKMLVLT